MWLLGLTWSLGLAGETNATCIVGAETVDLAAARCASWRADPEAAWSIDQVRNSEDWTPIPESGLQLGYVQGDTWLRVALAPGPDAPPEVVLALGLPQTDSVDVWVGDAATPLESGDARPRNPEFPANAQPAAILPLKEPAEVWVRVRTQSLVSLRPTVYDVPAFRRRVRALDLTNTVILSVIATVTGLFGLIGAIGRDAVLLRYALHLLLGLVYGASITSWGGALLSPGLAPQVVLTLAIASVAAGLSYLQHLLAMPAAERWLRRGLQTLGVGVLGLWVSPVWFGGPLAALTIVAALWLMLWATLLAAREARRWSRGSLVAWSPLVLSTAVGLLATLGVLAFDYYLWLVRAAFLWQFAVMTTLLAQRFAEQRDRELAAQRDLRAREHELVQAQRVEALGRLAGGIAHDFNNVLTVILGNLWELRDESAPHLQSSVDDALGAAERGAALVRQLLTYARGAPEEHTTVAVDAVITDVASMFRRTLGSSTDLVIELDAPSAMVWADRSQLEQVVANLVVNGRDALQSTGGKLVVRTRRDADEVCISVADTGPGIPEDVLDSIFEPFFTTKGEHGTGLGLSTAQRVVRAHGGRLCVTSAVGEGTTFEVWLPLAMANRAASTR